MKVSLYKRLQVRIECLFGSEYTSFLQSYTIIDNTNPSPTFCTFYPNNQLVGNGIIER